MAIKHGMSNTRIYNIWAEILRRTTKTNSLPYKNYGGRGIGICEEWKEFKCFYEDISESYIKHLEKHGKINTTLDRIDNDKGYSKDNCRWATRKEQARNTRKNRIIIWNGMTKCLSEWAEYLGIKSSTLRQRYYVYKWDIEKCLTY